MKSNHIFIAAMLMFLLSPQSFAASKGGTFKCWINKDHIRECGNDVPPEYAQGDTRTMNSRGLTVEEKPTEAQLRAQKKKEEALKKEPSKTQADANAPSKEQETYDRVLLASYLTEDDIAAARSRKVNAIDATIAYNTGIIAKLEEKLKKAQERTDNLKKAGRKPGAEDEKDIALMQKQLDEKKVFIASKQKGKEATNVEYDGYLKRFRELKAKDAKSQ